jgi:hypothetical protein
VGGCICLWGEKGNGRWNPRCSGTWSWASLRIGDGMPAVGEGARLTRAVSDLRRTGGGVFE